MRSFGRLSPVIYFLDVRNHVHGVLEVLLFLILRQILSTRHTCACTKFRKQICPAVQISAFICLEPSSFKEFDIVGILTHYRLEQFNDVLFLENGLSLDADSSLFDMTTLNAISNKEFSSQEVIKVYTLSLLIFWVIIAYIFYFTVYLIKCVHLPSW